MTYLAVMSAVLLGKIKTDDKHFKGNSLHGADSLFPGELPPGEIINHKISAVTDAAWQAWYSSILNAQIKPVIIKDSWINHPNWPDKITPAGRLSVISDCTTRLDFIYCYLNAVEKIPLHMYRRLMDLSEAHPTLWGKLNKKNKIKALGRALEKYPRKLDAQPSKNLLQMRTMQILDGDLLDRLASFYQCHGLEPIITDQARDFHSEFVRRQQNNRDLAQAISQGYRTARGPHDEILFHYLDHSGAMGS